MSKLKKGPLTIEVNGNKYPEWVEDSYGFWDFNRTADSDNPENYAANFLGVDECRLLPDGVYRWRLVH